MVEALVTETETTDTEPMTETETQEPQVEERERLVKEVEVWLTASAHRTVLEPRDIRELQTLLIDVWAYISEN